MLGIAHIRSSFSLSLSLWLAIGSAAALSGCAAEAPDEGAAGEAPHSERAGLGLAEVQQALGPGALVDARRSLAVTDTAALAPFTLTAVLDQLIAQSGASLTAAQLFRQLWDTQNAAPGQPDLPNHAHCSDNGGTLNGFPYPCRTGDGQQALPAGAITIASYAPIGLYNRFDLAPLDGSNCGEYRAVFGKLPGQGPGRSFIIFEAVLPNPRPDLGLEGCRPVANFWRDQTSAALSGATRASQLRTFYFTGLPGFRPVFHVDHYGGSSTGLGQVRTNQFVQVPWLLREFKLVRICFGGSSTNCPPRFVPSTVKVNPFGNLFNPASAHPLAAAFQSAFLNQVPLLAINNLNTFTMATEAQFNVGQSDSQTGGAIDNYVAQLGAGPSAFRTAIQARLTSIGSPLTPDQIVARALTQSCAGCHQRSNGANLGGGLVWPPSDSSGFVHNSEFTEVGPDGPRFRISPALTATFLPRRKVVLEAFLNKLRTAASGRAGLTHVAAFHDSVYFAETGASGPPSQQITKVSAGGSAVVVQGNRGAITGLAADANRLYWTEANGTIFRAVNIPAAPCCRWPRGAPALAPSPSTTSTWYGRRPAAPPRRSSRCRSPAARSPWSPAAAPPSPPSPPMRRASTGWRAGRSSRSIARWSPSPPSPPACRRSARSPPTAASSSGRSRAPGSSAPSRRAAAPSPRCTPGWWGSSPPLPMASASAGWRAPAT